MVSSFLFIFAGMEKIYNYYQDIVTAYTRRADNLKKKIHLLGSIRLLLVASLIAMVWFFKSEDWKVLAGIAILFTIPFIALMVWHTKLFARKCYAEALANLCKNELNGLDYDFSAFDGAPEKSSAEHSFSLDLDLFGNHSLFQSVNRTVTFMGKEKLAGWFMQPLTDKAMILRRQEAIRELESFTKFGGDMDAVTAFTIDKGQKNTQLLIQPQYNPMPVEQQIAILYCGTKGLLKEVPLDKVHDFENAFLQTLITNHQKDVLDILKSGVINDEVSRILEETAHQVSGAYKAG